MLVSNLRYYSIDESLSLAVHLIAVILLGVQEGKTHNKRQQPSGSYIYIFRIIYRTPGIETDLNQLCVKSSKFLDFCNIFPSLLGCVGNSVYFFCCHSHEMPGSHIVVVLLRFACLVYPPERLPSCIVVTLSPFDCFLSRL